MKNPTWSKPTRLALAFAITNITLTATAQEDAIEQEEVISWGTRVYSSSTNLSGEAMAVKQADHLSDLMRSVPGVDIGGAHSLNQRINIRGLDDKDLRISIDGANQNTYMYHHAGNLQIHADILKAVEIEVGANSVVNGGLGGAVRFQTKEAKDLLDDGATFGGRAQASYADNASTGGSLTAYAQLGSTVDLLAYINYVDRDNYTVGGGQIVSSDGEVINSSGEVQGLAGETTDILVKLGADLSHTQRVEFGYESYTDEGHYSYRPDMGLAVDLAIADSLGLPLTYPTEFSRDTATLNYEASFDSHSTLTAALFTNDSTLWRDESGVAAVYPDSASTVEGNAQNTGFNLLANTVLGDDTHSFTYGFEYIQFDTDYLQDGVRVSGEKATNLAVFLEDTISINGGFRIIPGVRYDRYEVTAVVVEDTFNDLSTALAFEKDVGENILLRASSTQLFKGPELSEVFVGAGIRDTANPGIKAESGRNDQASIAWNNNSFEAGATLFKTQIDNYIDEYADANIGDLSIDGYESYFGYSNSGKSILVSYSHADSSLNAYEGYESFEGARLDRSIGDTLAINMHFTFPRIDASISWESLVVSDLKARPDLDQLNNPKEGHTIHNISSRWSPESVAGLEILLGIDNLLDEHYASQASRTGNSFHPRFGALHLTDYEPGRNIKLTVSYTF